MYCQLHNCVTPWWMISKEAQLFVWSQLASTASSSDVIAAQFADMQQQECFGADITLHAGFIFQIHARAEQAEHQPESKSTLRTGYQWAFKLQGSGGSGHFHARGKGRTRKHKCFQHLIMSNLWLAASHNWSVSWNKYEERPFLHLATSMSNQKYCRECLHCNYNMRWTQHLRTPGSTQMCICLPEKCSECKGWMCCLDGLLAS